MPSTDIARQAVRLTEDIGRIQLSTSFFFRDFLYSEIATTTGLPNIPTDIDLAVEVGRRLCIELLEPLQDLLGPIRIRSGYRSELANEWGNRLRLGCASNPSNYGRHIWDRRDDQGCIGAMACVVVPAFVPYYEQTGDWQSLAWFIHDHLPYSELAFFSRLAAFNIGWRSLPVRSIQSFIPPTKGYLTRPGRPDNAIGHADAYAHVPLLREAAEMAKHLDPAGKGV